MITPALYVVATPIGNLQDLTPRAQQILREVALVAAEDTRHSRPLLQHFGITTPLFALHEHNEKYASEQLLQRLQAGEAVALISDAGTPLVSDPGAHLVAAAHQAGVNVVPIPGASAVIAALSASGLAAEQFVFAGFVPSKATAREQFLQYLSTETRTLIFYEAPHRILTCIEAMQHAFGAARLAVLAKELTKIHETVYRGSLTALHAWLQADPLRQKGEFVVVVAGAPVRDSQQIDAEAERVLHILAATLPLKQAAKLTSEITGVSKNALYNLGLAQKAVLDRGE